MACIDCHAGASHRMRGRGVDLMGSDSRRTSCAAATARATRRLPTQKELLNRHAVRVDCTVCHIPAFAKDDATDMVRDWSTPAYSEAKDKHIPTFTMGKNVEPEIAWYNGTVWAQLPGVPVTDRCRRRGRDGRAPGLARRPEGQALRLQGPPRHDAGDRPTAAGCCRSTSRSSLPTATSTVRSARPPTCSTASRTSTTSGCDVERYMGIFHEVQPARQRAALSRLPRSRRSSRLGRSRLRGGSAGGGSQPLSLSSIRQQSRRAFGPAFFCHRIVIILRLIHSFR